MISTSVPPLSQVEKMSWNETSKDSEANCSVRACGGSRVVLSIQPSRFSSGRCVIKMPLGLPVEPEV